MDYVTYEPIEVLSQFIIPIILIITSSIITLMLTVYSKTQDKNKYIKNLKNSFPIIEDYFYALKISNFLRAGGFVLFLWCIIIGGLIEIIIMTPLIDILGYILKMELLRDLVLNMMSNIKELDVVLFINSYLIIVSQLLFVLFFGFWLIAASIPVKKVPEISESCKIKIPTLSTQIVYLSIWIFSGIITGMNFIIHYNLLKILQTDFSFNWNWTIGDAYTYFVTNAYYFIYYLTAYLFGVFIYLFCVFGLYFMLRDLSEHIIKLITDFYNRDFPKVKITTENGEVNAIIAGILDKELIILSEETVVTMIPWNKIEILEASKIDRNH